MIATKTKEEIAIMREGGRRHAFILAKLAEMVKPGLAVRELEETARKLVAEGGDKSAFLNYTPEGATRPYPAALCVSVNDEVVHGIPNEKEKILREGDIVSLDLGLVHQGLITDAAVTVPVGTVKPELLRLIEGTKKALYAGIKAAKKGKRVGDVSSAIETVAASYGFGIVQELSGHGVGYKVHEDPCIPNYGQKNRGPILSAGLTMAIEPIFNLGDRGIFLDDDGYTYRTNDGLPSAHFEHTVVVTKSGAEILTA